MNAMAKLAAQENRAMRKNWDRGIVEASPAQKRAKTMQDLARGAAKETGVNMRLIMGRSQERHIALARQYCMWVLRNEGFSSVVIGRHFKRDHSTVLFACKKINKVTADGDTTYDAIRRATTGRAGA